MVPEPEKQMEETAGGGSGGCKYLSLHPADCQGAHPLSRGARTHCSTGLQHKRSPDFFTGRGLLRLYESPTLLICSLHEHVKVADDRFGVKTVRD